MDLILWRHAEAEDAAPLLPDHKRRLTPRGEKHAKHVGVWLRKHLPRKTRILVSPTERTQQTAHALDMTYEIEPKVGVGATATGLLAAADWPNREETVLIIGHQPTLGRVAALLMTGTESDWSVKKGGLWWFSTRMRANVSQNHLRTVIHPELL